MRRSIPSMAPTLRTERLTLQASSVDDFEGSVAMWGEPAVVRYIGGRPFSREEIWSRLLRHAGLWALPGFGCWTVRDTGSGRFVGQVGFGDYKRDITPDPGDAPERGWVLASWAHGRGDAGEALGSALAWADHALDARRTVCFIEHGHGASVRVAHRAGYAAYTQGAYKGADVTLFERVAPTSTAEAATA